MKLSQLANPRILEHPTYQPGKPIELVAEEFGFQPQEVCKLASNENPWGASSLAIEAGCEALKKVHLYPEGSGHALRKQLAGVHDLKEGQFVLGNGSNEIIELLGHVFLQPGDEVILGEHSFIVYKLVSLLFGAQPVSVEMPELTHDLNLMRDAVSERTKLIFLPSPNNPTGTANSKEQIFAFVRSLPDHVIFCFDEAYAEYLEHPADLRPLIHEGKKIIALRTFSKIHGLANLRIGYGYGSREMIDLLQQARQPFNANGIAQACAIAALQDEEWVIQCRKRNLDGLDQLAQGFERLTLEFVPSQANFMLVKVGHAKKVFQDLQRKGVITRPMAGSLENYLRISVGTEHENDRALQALEEVLSFSMATI